MMRRRSGLVAAVAALVVLGLSGCDTYEVTVEQEGGVDYLVANEVGANDTVFFFGFLPEFTEFQLDPDGGSGGPLLDDDGNFVPAAAGEAWVDDFTSIIPAFLTSYPANSQIAIDSFNEDLICNIDPSLNSRLNEDTGLYENTSSMEDSDYCEDSMEFSAVMEGLQPFFAPFGPMTEDPSAVVGGVARLDLSQSQNGFCGVRVIALEVPYTSAELEDIFLGEFGVSTIEAQYELVENLVGFVEAGELATTNGYFVECVDENGSGAGAAPASTTAPKLATTGANVEWLMVAGFIALIAGASFLAVSRRKRTV